MTTHSRAPATVPTLGDIVADALRPAYASSPPFASSITFHDKPIDRMFASPTGRQAVNRIGNEGLTATVLAGLGAELLVEMAAEQGLLCRDSAHRVIVIPGSGQLRAAVALLQPDLPIEQTRRVTGDLRLDATTLDGLLRRISDKDLPAPVADVLRMFLKLGRHGLEDLLWINQPELVVSRSPRMVPLSCPWPGLDVVCSRQSSTLGVFCRDVDGELGVTACFHGTGEVGTEVLIGGNVHLIKAASEVQDLVFIPLGNGYPLPPVRAAGGIRVRPPAQQDPVEFHGGKSREVHTYVSSHDAGLLRKRPTVQLKVQTPADTNNGDSGAALLDDDDRVVGFAFERSAFGEVPQLTDWIWADNALAALGLTVV